MHPPCFLATVPDSLSTLRSADYSNPTQDSLLAAGQALPDGLSTRRIPMKGFRSVNYISFPFPKLCLAQLHRPTLFGGGLRRGGCPLIRGQPDECQNPSFFGAPLAEDAPESRLASRSVNVPYEHRSCANCFTATVWCEQSQEVISKIKMPKTRQLSKKSSAQKLDANRFEPREPEPFLHD